MPVAVVTDSTASLSAYAASAEGVLIVPLQVVVDGNVYDEGIDIQPADVAEALRAHRRVTTSRPRPQLFLDALQSKGVKSQPRVLRIGETVVLSS